MSAVTYQYGFKLTTPLEAQRGMTEAEALRFLATGEALDLSQPASEPSGPGPDFQDISLSDARAWLTGERPEALVAAVARWFGVPEVLVAKFDPHQPRDSEGKWTDGPPDAGGVPDFPQPGGSSATSESLPAGKRAVPAVIYKKHADGAVVAEAGGRRMRWDAGVKKFVVERRQDGDWQETSQLTKSAAYDEMKQPGRWSEPGTLTDNEISLPETPPETPEPASIDSQPTVETDTYTGPRFEGDFYKYATDAGWTRDDVDEFFDLMVRDSIGGDQKLEYDETHKMYEMRSMFYGVNTPRAAGVRFAQNAQNTASFKQFKKLHNITMPDDELKADLARRTREAFAGKKIGVRVNPADLSRIINDGRIKTQFESGKSKGKFAPGYRAQFESAWFGLDEKKTDPKVRPIYGYVMTDGVRPAGLGSADIFAPATDALSQYGQIQIVLKDQVRDRTTAMFGDSLNNYRMGQPSPVNNPSWQSFSPPPGKSMMSRGLNDLDRKMDESAFRSGTYAEAQIHGGVTLADIDEVLFPTTPTAAVQKELNDAGVKWRVLNFKTAADGTPQERADALRVARQDLAMLDDQIADTQKKIPEYQAKNDNYTVKQLQAELKKVQVQRKRIADALPKLEKGSQ